MGFNLPASESLSRSGGELSLDVVGLKLEDAVGLSLDAVEDVGLSRPVTLIIGAGVGVRDVPSIPTDAGLKFTVCGVYSPAMGVSLCPESLVGPRMRMASRRRGWKKCCTCVSGGARVEV